MGSFVPNLIDLIRRRGQQTPAGQPQGQPAAPGAPTGQLPQGHFGTAPPPPAPTARLGQPPLGPAAQPPAAAAPGVVPQLHGWRRALDVAGQYLTPGLESSIPGTPGHALAQQQRAQEEEQLRQHRLRRLFGPLGGGNQ